MTQPATPTRGALIWDLPVRLSHWGLVLCVLGSYLSGKFGWPSMEWHFWFGYGALGIVLFRLLWSLVGGEHARLVHLLRGPAAVWRHLRELFGPANHYQRVAGHAASGGWASLLLLLLTGTQAALGLFTSDEIQFYGPLSEQIDSDWMQWLSGWHRQLEFWLLLLIGMHLVAIASYWLLQRDALLPAMWHGRKAGFSTDARRAPVWLAWLIALLVVVAIWALLRFWPVSATGSDLGY